MFPLLLQIEICLILFTNTVLTQEISVNLNSIDDVKMIDDDVNLRSIEDIDNFANNASSDRNQKAVCNESRSCENGGSCLKHACLCLPGTSGPMCEIVDDCQRERICKKDEYTMCEYSVDEQKAICHCRIMEYRFDDATKGCRSCLCTPTFSQDLGSFSYCEYKQGQQMCTCTKGYAYNPHEEICDNCDCGRYSKWCAFNEKGNRVCGCEDGYVDSYGMCRECECGSHGRCTLDRYSDYCECESGYEQYKRKCVECSCGINGKCVFNENGTQTGCECLPGYTEKMGKCEMCQCGDSSNCSFSGNTKICDCQDGFENVNGFCTDIDECEKHNPCNASTRCVNTPGSYKCVCDKGYKRNHETLLCDDIDECRVSSTCSEPYTRCVNTVGSFKCVCESNLVIRGGSDSNVFCEPADSKLIYTVSFSVFVVAFVLGSAVLLHQLNYLRRRNAIS